MADVVLSGLRWVVSPIVNKLLADASAYLGVDMARELQDLEITVLPQFELVIAAAEKSPHKSSLEKWLRNLKDAYYEAEDLLDEHEYSLLEKDVKKKKNNKKHTSPAGSSDSSSSRRLQPLHDASSRLSNLMRPNNRKLLRKMQELKSILAKAKTFRELLGLPISAVATQEKRVDPLPKTASLLASEVFGRDADRHRIIDLLTKDRDMAADGIFGVAIVGHGGAGKSTLAQYVYNDDMITKNFDAKMWVCISRKLDVHQHTKEIIESTTKKECPPCDSLDALQCHLRDILQKSEKVLLVLDDVWFDKSNNEMEWEQLLAPFVSRQGRSRFLVTSRSRTLPVPLRCEQVVDLKNMEDAEFLKLFNHHAFSGEKIRDPLLRKKLENIANKIARSLGHSPLAAKAVGSRLSREKDVTAWERALMDDNLRDARRALYWSYEKLDPRLQRCFLYCSLFPKGCRYYSDELVKMWFAEGFIGSCNSNKRIEDIGRDYVNEMVYCSFFQPTTGYGDGFFTMHDLLHDLAQSLTKEDYFCLDDDTVTKIPETIRYLSVGVKSVIKHKENICKLRHLRTILCFGRLVDDVSDIFHQVLQNSKKLRLLKLVCYNGEMLPGSIGELKQLRYLNLSGTSINKFPGSLCTLYHLQALELSYNTMSLPDKMSNLIKLRRCNKAHLIPDVGKLTSLQELNEFIVQKEKGYKLQQLREMNELGGKLSIRNLENVIGKDEAIESMLHQKIHLEYLELAWSQGNKVPSVDFLHLDILEGLRPPPQLKGLGIHCYQSATFPSWLLEASYFENLESFRLSQCHILQGLPPEIELFKHLSKLELDGVPNTKTLPCLPVGLTRLSVEGCPMLMFTLKDELEQYDIQREDDLVFRIAFILDEIELGSYLWKKCLLEEHSSLSQLMLLMVENISQPLQTIKSALEREEECVEENVIKAWLCCHEQRMELLYARNVGMPLVLPSALRKLTLSSCSITDGALARCLECLTSLTSLSLSYIMTIRMLPSEAIMEHLIELQSLNIAQCWCLRSLGGLRAATSLSNINLTCCPSLELACGAEFMPSSLESLYIQTCVIGDDFCCGDLPHLSRIQIDRCRSSASLSIGDLSSLKLLELLDMPDLCTIKGMHSLTLDMVALVYVPRLDTRCFSRCQVQETLTVSSSAVLNRMLSAEGFKAPARLCLINCNEISISFERSPNFAAVKNLEFWSCEIQSLPPSLESFSCLERLEFWCCPNISALPDLPTSLHSITIGDCDLLRESCRKLDGESWPKIAHVPWKHIT